MSIVSSEEQEEQAFNESTPISRIPRPSLFGHGRLVFVNTDMTDRRGMLAGAPEVVCLIIEADAPLVSATNGALIKLLKIALGYQVSDAGGELMIGKGILVQRVRVDSQVIETSVKL